MNNTGTMHNVQKLPDEILCQLPLPSFADMFGDLVSPSMFADLPTRQELKRKHDEDQQGKEIRQNRMIVAGESGRWSISEQSAFFHGLIEHGKDWRKILPLIRTRNLCQLRTHGQKVGKKLSKVDNANMAIFDKQGEASDLDLIQARRSVIEAMLGETIERFARKVAEED